MKKPIKIYQVGNSQKIHYTVKDAKKYALEYYGLGKEYILHSGLLYEDGETVLNSGKMLITA
jgi:hypothetical protein